MSIKLDYLLITKSGSHLYGTNHEDSDIDIRGIVYEPLECLLGLGYFEQSLEPYAKDIDTCFYGLKKFSLLALDCNPNIVELLFVPIEYEEIVKYYSPDFLSILKNREYFLSRKAFKTFSGYAVSQFKKMETHYKWMSNKALNKPNPFDYGYQVHGEDTEWSSYKQKVIYDAKLKEYQQYETWLKNRNPKRHNLEEKFGYDSKNALHLVRLLWEYEELSLTGEIQFPLSYKDKLLDILNGALTYAELKDYMNQKLSECENNLEKSILSNKPNYGKINELVSEINYRRIKNGN